MGAAIFEFAGIPVKLKYINEEVAVCFQKYRSGNKPKLKLSTSKSDIARERQLSEEREQNYPDWYIETLAIHRKLCAILAKKQVILFHSSAIAVDGVAYLFTAPSGTGKSTHVRLWREMLGERAVMINDDKPFLRLTENQVYVYGSPWNGKHRLDTNICVPLKAICFLEQGAENHIHRFPPKEAFARLCRQVYFPEDRTKCAEIIGFVGELAKMPIYLMQCNISREAAELSYHTMKED